MFWDLSTDKYIYSTNRSASRWARDDDFIDGFNGSSKISVTDCELQPRRRYLYSRGAGETALIFAFSTESYIVHARLASGALQRIAKDLLPTR